MISIMISKEHSLGLSRCILDVSLNILIFYPFELEYPPTRTLPMSATTLTGPEPAPPPPPGTGSAGPGTGGGMKTSCLPRC